MFTATMVWAEPCVPALLLENTIKLLGVAVLAGGAWTASKDRGNASAPTLIHCGDAGPTEVNRTFAVEISGDKI